MHKNYDTVIFDMDGTLLDTLEDLKDAVNYAMCQYGLPQHTLEEIRNFVGNGIRRLLELSVPQGEAHPAFEDILKTFRAYYSEHCMDKTRPYAGIVDLLQQLKRGGFAVAIVSNKVDSAVKTLNREHFGDLVEVAIGETQGIARKPAPDMIEKALQHLHRTKETAVYVGDSEVDLATAANAGLPCISVLWGFREKEFLAGRGAAQFAATPLELATLLTGGGKA